SHLSLFACSLLFFALANSAAYDSISCIACRLRCIVVGIHMNDERRPFFGEEGMAHAFFQCHPIIDDCMLHCAIRFDFQVLHIASMRFLRIVKPVFFSVRIEMTSSRFKIGRLANSFFMDMKTMHSFRKM